MRLSRCVPIAGLAFVWACASDSTTSPTSDVDALVDEAATASYSTAARGAFVGGAGVTMPPTSAGACAYSPASQRFECAPLTSNGVTFTRSFALLDANGVSLSVANPATVAAINTITTIKGTITSTSSSPTGGQLTMTLDHRENATLSQLQSPTHLLNGTSTDTTDLAFSGLSLTSNETSTTSNLQLPRPTADVHWPLGGTMTTDRTMTSNGSAPITSHEVISFDGTSVITITRTSGGTTTTCKIDLTKAGLPICS
jgi:hypothetical protein